MKSQTFQPDIQQVEQFFSLINAQRISAFLEKYPFLFSIVIDAQLEIRRYFPDAALSLEVIADPEWPSDTQLALYIATGLSPEEAVATLNEFDNQWWLDALPLTEGKLCIDLRYR